jgi:hypothetical protein
MGFKVVGWRPPYRRARAAGQPVKKVFCFFFSKKEVLAS